MKQLELPFPEEPSIVEHLKVLAQVGILIAEASQRGIE